MKDSLIRVIRVIHWHFFHSLSNPELEISMASKTKPTTR
jgi:hypothetical protein